MKSLLSITILTLFASFSGNALAWQVVNHSYYSSLYVEDTHCTWGDCYKNSGLGYNGTGTCPNSKNGCYGLLTLWAGQGATANKTGDGTKYTKDDGACQKIFVDKNSKKDILFEITGGGNTAMQCKVIIK